MRKANTEQLNSIRHLEYKDGAAKGLEVFEVNNGVLNFEVLVSKCLDISRLFFKGTNISFLSKNGLVAATNVPYNKRFPGGLLFTCGLDSIGARESFPVHGSIHDITASNVNYTVNENGVKITGEMRDSALFGKNLILIRTISTNYKSRKIEILDEVKNNGFRDEDFCLLYHINFGFPLLDNKTEIVADFLSSRGRDNFAKENLKDCKKMTGPIDNEQEQVFFHTQKEGKVKVQNKEQNLSVTIEYDNILMPHLIEWKSMVSGDYALGIEPSTSLFDDEFSYSKVPAGDSIKFKLSLEIEN